MQRFLTARSVNEARSSLLMSAYWKIPMQALVLLLGVLVFVFHVFNAPPLLFSSEADARLKREAPDAYAALQQEHDAAIAARLDAARRLRAMPTTTAARAAVRAADADVQQIRRRGA